jgi:hypothetical protein
VENPCFKVQKKRCLAGLAEATLDAPTVPIIQALNACSYRFTLQCCYGHFLYEGQLDKHNLATLPPRADIDRVEYRIAYIAFCVENSPTGRRFLAALEALPAIDPENIQLGSAEWFWQKQINSYVLQVEPDRFKHKDTAILDFKEALYIEKIRKRFFAKLKAVLREPFR